ncbi:Zinc finger protein zfs1 [Trametes pubescens]|uniref:Zinc finger protein zfs1 n=1 Tax=Trametes pubescens TaxID=154538 RepID=A0A1M2VAY8_TRAPU|nr:Zinc finger protein zfs1 [Trametes pubescens]
MATRRTPTSALGKGDLSDRNMATPPNGAGHWRLDSNGQLVDSSDWDLADEIVKLQIGDGNENQSANLNASHSRESSADTTGSQGSALSSNSQTLRAPPVTPLKVGAVGESRNRPHSYSGGLSSTDLIRLQQAGGSPGNNDSWSSPNGTPERQQQQAEQLTYPSLLGSHNGSASRLSEQSLQQNGMSRPQEEIQIDYQAQQQRQYNHSVHGAPPPPSGAPAGFVHGRPPNVATNLPYRQPPPRGFNPGIPPVVPTPTNFAGYPTPVHHGAMPVGGPQQDLYNMMMSTPPLENPTMARLQQQSGVFQRTHHHSASDPASLRDPATLALLNNAFAAGQMYAPAMGPQPGLSMFANQFYGGPDAYSSPELAAQMMAQLNAQYTSSYGPPLGTPGLPLTNTGSSIATHSTGNGPSANNRKLGLYKTELCRSWEEKGSCRYGAKCQFAHGEDELRKVQRHPKYKTEICRTFWVSGSCPYGKRCCFIHTELPANGAAPGADGTPPPSHVDGRARSSSTNSDPNDVSSSSILARISAKRTQENNMNSGSGSLSTTPPSAGFQVNGRPDSLRINTTVTESTTISKQNKSAYPTFAHNGVLMPAAEEPTARSPGPVTAGPDFGRHASSRLDIVGSQRGGPKTAVNPNVRHSFNGSEIPLDLSSVVTPTASNPNAQQLNASPEAPKVSRIHGHVRSGSAGNWGSATRNNHLTAYPLSSIPGSELKNTSPWADYNGSRLAEKNWA